MTVVGHIGSTGQYARYAVGSSKGRQGDWGGMTYLDTFFVHQSRASDESLYFHELIHVIQWRLLGPERFLAAYADGYEKHGYKDSPLEVMAYDAENTFVTATQPFDARKLVEEQLAL